MGSLGVIIYASGGPSFHAASLSPLLESAQNVSQKKYCELIVLMTRFWYANSVKLYNMPLGGNNSGRQTVITSSL